MAESSLGSIQSRIAEETSAESEDPAPHNCKINSNNWGLRVAMELMLM